MHDSFRSDTNTMITLPRYLVEEVLADGTCPLHLRLQLSRFCAQSDVHGQGQAPGLLAEARCVTVVASYLPHGDVLSVRRCNLAMLSDVMQRAPCEEERLCGAEGARAKTPSFPDMQGISSGEDAPARRRVSALTKVHARIECRLWLARLARLTAGSSDETVFETRVRSFVDEATRQRSKAEILAAKAEVLAVRARMEGEIVALQDEVERRMASVLEENRARLENKLQAVEDAVAQQEALEAQIRELEGRVAHMRALEARVEELEARLRAAMAASAHTATQQNKTAGGSAACWAFLARWRHR